MNEGDGIIRDADPSEGNTSPFPDKTDKPKTGETGSPSPKGTGSEKTDKGEKDKGTKDQGEKKDPGSGTGSGTDAGTGGDKDRTGTGDSGKPE